MDALNPFLPLQLDHLGACLPDIADLNVDAIFASGAGCGTVDDSDDDDFAADDKSPTNATLAARRNFPRLQGFCDGNPDFLDISAIKRSESKTFRGLPPTGHIMWQRYVADKTESEVKREAPFVQALGQCLRFALANGSIGTLELASDFALFSVLNPATLTEYVRFGEAHLGWSRSTLHSYTTTMKTGFRRLVKWLDVDARFSGNQPSTRWVKNWVCGREDNYEAVYWTREEVVAKVDDWTRVVEAEVARHARTAKRNVRNARGQGQHAFHFRFSNGLLVNPMEVAAVEGYALLLLAKLEDFVKNHASNEFAQRAASQRSWKTFPHRTLSGDKNADKTVGQAGRAECGLSHNQFGLWKQALSAAVATHLGKQRTQVMLFTVATLSHLQDELQRHNIRRWTLTDAEKALRVPLVLAHEKRARIAGDTITVSMQLALHVLFYIRVNGAKQHTYRAQARGPEFETQCTYT